MDKDQQEEVAICLMDHGIEVTGLESEMPTESITEDAEIAELPHHDTKTHWYLGTDPVNPKKHIWKEKP